MTTLGRRRLARRGPRRRLAIGGVLGVAVLLAAYGPAVTGTAASSRGAARRPTASAPPAAGAPATVATATSHAATAPAVTATSRPFAGTPSVGPLFASASAVAHSCTASVVDSPAGDLLVTAAHCVSGTGAGLVFAPGYADGAEPYGTWTVTAAYGASGWLTAHDPTEDVAFLVVAPRVVARRTVEIESVTGAAALAGAPAAGTVVTVPAYNGGDDDDPITCTRPISETAGYPTFACDGYVDGSSGAPWIEATAAGPVVVGVVGGLHQGGCTEAVSYSPDLSTATRQAYLAAVAGDQPSSFPPPGGDGCSTGL